MSPGEPQSTGSEEHTQSDELNSARLALEVERRRCQELFETNQALEHRADQLAALYETARDLILPNDLPDLLQLIVDRATTLLQAPGGAILLWDDVRCDLQILAAKGYQDPPLGSSVQWSEGIAGRVAQTRRSMVIDNYRAWDSRLPEYDNLQVAAALVAPMLYAGELVGVLAVNEFEPASRKFDKSDAHLLDLLASQAASAVHDARLFQDVRSGRERLQVFSRRLMQLQEAERRHIARELHDEIGQILTAVKTNLQTLQVSGEAFSASAELADSMSIVDRALEQVRSLSLDLRPSVLDDFGLVPALQWYIAKQAQRAGFTAELIVDKSGPRMPPDVETACFRVVQEAVTNIVRHAQAKRVVVEVERENGDLRLTICDDGIGFDVRAARKRAGQGSSMGLLGMQERVLLAGGQIEIKSSPSQGTEIRARFPADARKLVERRQKRRRAR